jgi:maleate cis-trans isomerase
MGRRSKRAKKPSSRSKALQSLARAAFVPEADAMLIACTDFGTLPVVSTLEAEFGIPIVTSNQAQLWATLRAATIHDPVPGWGGLLDGTRHPVHR